MFSDIFLLSSKYIAAGLSVGAISGAGVGIGFVFGDLISGSSVNLENKDALFSYAILGFALVEAIALFGLMMAFLFIFGL